MTRDDFRRLRWLREAAREIQPFHQRSFYSANPDLSFHQMNGDAAAEDVAVSRGRPLASGSS